MAKIPDIQVSLGHSFHEASVRVRGENISNVVMGVDMSYSAKDGQKLVLYMVPGAVALSVGFENVTVDRTTSKAMRLLGWTPPGKDGKSLDSVVRTLVESMLNSGDLSPEQVAQLVTALDGTAVAGE